MSEIKIEDNFEEKLLKAGMVKEIPISDEHVVAVLRSVGFEIKDTPHGNVWKNKNGNSFILFSPGDVKAVAHSIDIVGNEKDEVMVAILYTITGISGEVTAVKAISDLVEVSPKVIDIDIKDLANIQ